MKSLEIMTGPDIVKEYNSLAARHGKTPVKKFSTLANGRERLAKLRAEVNSHKAKREVLAPETKIFVVNTASKKRMTQAEHRWLKLVDLEEKTVKNYLDKVGKKGSGDIKYWAEGGRIKLG